MERKPSDPRTKKPTERPPLSWPRRLRFLLLIALVCALTAAVHWPALSARAYSFDDSQYMLKNPLVLAPSWESARRFLVEVLEPSTVNGYYQPLSMISLMLDAAWGGGPTELRPFHRTSLALHAANTALIIVLLYLLFRSAPAAVLAGLIFGVHPLTVEPIPWIGERKTLLGAFFALSCLILYVCYARRWTGRNPADQAERQRQETRGMGRAGRRTLYAASLAAYLLALMSKPTTTPIPALLLLLDYWPLRRLSRSALFEKVPFLVLGAVSAVITVISQARTASVTLPEERPGGWIPLTLCHNIVFYLYKIVWPANLSSHYPFPEPFSLAHPRVLAGVLGTAVLAVALLLSWRRTRAVVTGWLFFFVAIFPTLGVIGFTDVIASDKFAYLPMTGLLMLLAAGLAHLWTRARAGRTRGLVVGSVLVIAAAESVATRRYLHVWQDNDRFWRHMLDRAPRASMLRSNYAGFLLEAARTDEAERLYREALELRLDNYAAHNGLGGILVRRGRIEEGLGHLQEADRIRPGDFVVLGNIAAALERMDRMDEALERYGEALKLKPQSPEVHFNYAGALARSGDAVRAADHYAEATRLSPRWAEPHHQLGILLASQGGIEEAVEHFSEAVRLKPDSAAARKSLGVALAQLGRIQEAVAQYQEALRLSPGIADVHFNLANALQALGREQDALAAYREAVRLAPDDADAHFNLAQLLIRGGQTETALIHYAEAVRARPEWPEARNDLGVLLAQKGRFKEAAAQFHEAVRLRPDWLEAQENLARALAQAGG